MNKRFLNAAAAVLLIAAFSATSCKKSDDSQSRHDILVNGEWNLSKIGDDANNNGVMDANEAVPHDSAGVSASVNFYSDNTYQLDFITNDTIVFKGNWTLINGDQTIRTIVTNMGPNDTTLLDIHNITSSNLTLLQRGDTTGTWEVFQR